MDGADVPRVLAQVGVHVLTEPVEREHGGRPARVAGLVYHLEVQTEHFKLCLGSSPILVITVNCSGISLTDSFINYLGG